MQEVEIWKPCVGWERFEVSNLGRVRNDRGQIMKQCAHKKGSLYRIVRFYIGKKPNGNSKYKVMLVHRLVAMAFLPNPDNLTDVNHKDENPSNNCVDNLEWTSHHENIMYSWNIHKTYPCVEDRKTKVCKIDPDTGEIIATYSSQREAGDANGLTQSAIFTSIKEHWKMHGYYYQYAD